MSTTTAPRGESLVMLPRDWLFHPNLSNAAKLLLAGLCWSANRAGCSWKSYEQLREYVGQRSRASICAYVKELRREGFLQTRRQTRKDGSNYRLHFTVIPWKDFVACRFPKRGGGTDALCPADAAHPGAAERTDGASSAPPHSVQPVERRVRPVERSGPKGPENHLSKNHPDVSWSDDLWTEGDERAWRRHRDDRDPISAVGPPPPPELLHRLLAAKAAADAAVGRLTGDDLRDAVGATIDAFMTRHGIRPDRERRAALTDTLAAVAPTRACIVAAAAALDAAWRPHWRLLPTSDQASRMVQEPVRRARPAAADWDRVVRFNGRAGVARLWLRRLAVERVRYDANGTGPHGTLPQDVARPPCGQTTGLAANRRRRGPSGPDRLANGMDGRRHGGKGLDPSG